MITSDDLDILASERQADLRREAELRRLVSRSSERRPIRIVVPRPSRLATTAASALALAGILRVER